MFIPKAKHLKFESFHDSPPLKCNACGKEITTGFMADVFLDLENSNDTFSFIVCNRTCEKAFKYSRFSDKYVRENIIWARKHAKPKQTIEGAIFINFKTQELEIDFPKMLEGLNLPDTEENRQYCKNLAQEIASKAIPDFINNAMSAENN